MNANTITLFAESAPQDLLELLRGDMTEILLGTAIVVIGGSALGVSLILGAFRERLLLWFGSFAGLYGVRMLAGTAAFRVLYPRVPWDYLDAGIDYIIIVPALLFTIRLYGKGWKETFQWWLWFQVAYAAFALGLDYVTRVPGAAPDPGAFLLVVMPILVALGHVLGYRPPPIAEGRILIAGTSVFTLFVLNEHLVNAGLVPWAWSEEPIGFFLFLCCLGYVAARRFFLGAQRLISLEREMEMARQIQATLLPREMPRLRGVSIAARYLPMSAVAGDFYDFLPAGEARLGVLVADVSGHGVPAALIASMIKIAIQSQAADSADPACVMANLNRILYRELRGEGRFATAGYLFLDLEEQTARYAGAGHPPLLLWRRSSATLEEVEQNGLLLGFRAAESYPAAAFDLIPGDRLILCTDGILEAENTAMGWYGDVRLRELIRTQEMLPADEFAEMLLKDLSTWTGNSGGAEHSDDLTLLVLDILDRQTAAS